MKRTLAKAIVVIAEAGIDLLAERIKNRRKRNGNTDGLDHLSDGRGAYDLHNRSTAHSSDVGHRRAMRKRNTHGPSIFKERQ